MSIEDKKIALDKMRRDFVANVSHELRTPLTVIHGYLELLLSDKKDPQKAIHEQMFQETTRMENIISDLLLLSKLESEDEHKVIKRKIAMAPLIRAIVKDAKRLSGDKLHQFLLDIDEALLLLGSKAELRSLMSNLIFNAVKYTPALGSITIVWRAETSGPVFSVRDTGIGIAEKHLPRLTERFYRVDKARSRKSGGTGLGLAIVKHVLMRHDGILEIESEPNKGTLFRCKFLTPNF